MSLSEYSCKICSSEVKDTDPAVLGDLCGKWIYTDCASIGETQYENLKGSPLPWYCPYCIMELPFFTVKNNDLHKLLSDSHNNHPKSIPRKMNKKTKEFLKKFCEMSQIFEQSENPLSCDYYDISDFKKLKINKQQDLSVRHLNISSISAPFKHFFHFSTY